MGIRSFLACWLTATGSGPALAAPSESRTTADGGCLGFEPCSNCSASSSASPVSVPPLGTSESTSDRAWAWSAAGPWTASAEVPKPIAPTRTLEGSWSMNALAADTAAARRVGCTS